MTRTDNKITLCKIRLNLNACKTISKAEIDSLSNNSKKFFPFCTSFPNQAQAT